MCLIGLNVSHSCRIAWFYSALNVLFSFAFDSGANAKESNHASHCMVLTSQI